MSNRRQPHVPFPAEDRGRARYFHGRTQIVNNFKHALDAAAATNDGKHGTTFLIQGAPGAGKTALLEHLSDIAKLAEWKTAHVNIRSFTDPIVMAHLLGQGYANEAIMEAGANVVGFTEGGTRSLDVARTMKSVLKRAAGKNGLVLVLDEAQSVSDLINDTDGKDTLILIHNGRVGRPVILLAGGLGHTSNSFDLVNISRFQAGHSLQVGRLSRRASKAVIKDWLTKEGRAKAQEKGVLDKWVDTIAEEADDWPQHIVTVAYAAVRWLKANGRKLTDSGLARVLEAGRDAKQEFYRNRTRTVGIKDQAVLGAILQRYGLGKRWDRDTLIRAFNVYSRTGDKTGEDVVDTAIAKGVLAGAGELYEVPIPSMEKWLIRQYVRLPELMPLEYKRLQNALPNALEPLVGD